MSVKTLIFGARSNLSKQLHANIKNSELISTKYFLENEHFFDVYKNTAELNIIINSFYPAEKINYFSEPLKYIEDSIYFLANLLEEIKKSSTNSSFKIKKIIYTSSASVYGNNNYCSESDILMPLNFHSSLKISSEKLLVGFCNEMEIDYIIARVFNMYGGNDRFSVISKIIDAITTNKIISLANNGTAIRDFIHIGDVVKCYKEFLNIKKSAIINIASGEGISIKMILDYLRLKSYNVNIKNNVREEIKISTANVKELNSIVDMNEFINVIDFIESMLIKEINK